MKMLIVHERGPEPRTVRMFVRLLPDDSDLDGEWKIEGRKYKVTEIDVDEWTLVGTVCDLRDPGTFDIGPYLWEGVK